MGTPYLDGLRKKLAISETPAGVAMERAFSVAKYLETALSQASGDIKLHRPQTMPATGREPTHIRFGKNTHFGIGKNIGPHIKTKVYGYNIYLQPDKVYIITPNGKELRYQLTPELSDRIGSIIDMAHPRSGEYR